MRLIRRFEERVIQLVNANEIAGTTHEYIGEEAIAVGVCSMLKQTDIIASTHRGHGHIIAKGGDVKRMMAELFGRVTGYNRGKGGSMHIADLALGIYGANGIVAAGVPIAAGAAWAAKLRNTGQVAVAFFGDGGANQGVLHETMNLAGDLATAPDFRLRKQSVCGDDRLHLRNRGTGHQSPRSGVRLSRPPGGRNGCGASDGYGSVRR